MVNLNNTNEEEVNEDTSEEESSEEDTSDNEEQSEGVSEDDSEGSEEEQGEESEEEIDWQARALKAEKTIEKAKKKGKDKPANSSEETVIARLEARGILEENDQEFVLKHAKVEGISPIEALKDDYVKERLAASEKKRKSAQVAPKGNNRTGNAENEVNVLLRRYKKAESEGKDPANVLPDDNPTLTNKVLRALKNGA